MAEYNISAQITADTKGFESGVKKAQSASKKLGKSITDVVKGFGKSGLSGAITSAGLALGGIGLAVGTAVKAIKGITKALGECAEAYKVQLQAERALDTAINNSPYVSGTASKALKDFASEMQKVSNLGDEEIIPQMTQLIATGRTEAEVMKIIATASDMSASGAMSFDQAVTQLNATLNGNIGRLGQQNAELKALTKEELESGKAVEILGEKYKGLAQATVDTKKQLQNAIGDLKETFGSVFENAMAPMRKFFTEMIQGWADARKAKQEYEGAMIAIEKGEATANDYRIKEKKLLEEIEAIEGDLRKQAEELGMTYEEAYSSMADWQRVQLEAKKDELDTTQKLARMHEGLEKIKKLEGQWAEEEAKKKQEEIEKETRITDLKDEYLKKIAEQEAKWQHIKEVTGEQISNEEKIAFYQDSLVDLMTKAGGQITTNNQLYKDQMAIIEKLQSTIKPEEQKTSTEWAKKLLEQTIERLEAEKKATLESKTFAKKTAEEKYETEKIYNDRLLQLNIQRLQNEKELALESVKEYANAEEEKQRIIEYYDNEILDAEKEFATQVAEVSRKSWKNVFEDITKTVKTTTSIIKKMLNSVVSFMGNIFKKFNLQKVFEFNVDDALNNLLIFEDKVLTFFIETLPKLPNFLVSAVQSVSVMLNTILQSVDFGALFDSFSKAIEIIEPLISNILQSVIDILNKLRPVWEEKIKPFLEGTIKDIINMAMPIVVQVLNDSMNLMTEIATTVLDAIGEAMHNGFPQFLNSLINGLVQNLGKIIEAITNLIPDLLETVFNLLDEILDTTLPDLLDIIINLMEKVIPMVIAKIPKLIPKIIKLVSVLISKVAKILKDVVPALVKAILELVPALIVEVVKGVADLITNLTGNDLIELVLAVGSMLWKVLVEVIKIIPKLVTDIIDSIVGIITGYHFGDISKWLINKGKDIGERIKEGFTQGWEDIKKAFTDFKDWFKTTFIDPISEWLDKLLNPIREISGKVNETVVDGAKKVGGWIKGLFGFAGGTDHAPRGLALVGEAGPELVNFRGGEQVLTNANTKKALAGVSDNTWNVTFNNLKDTSAYAMMQQLRAYNRQMSINGVI